MVKGKEKVKGAGKPVTFSFDSLESQHEETLEQSTAPNEPMIEAHVVEETAKLEAALDRKDSKGTLFDPAIHAVNRDGDPSVTSLGKFRRKKGLSVLTESVALTDVKERAAARAAGQLAADLMIHSAIMLGGPEWNPRGTKDAELTAIEFNEHENLRRAFADYFEAKGISDFPPGVGLSIAVSGYMVPRFAGGKETRSRVAKVRDWFKGKFANIRKRKEDKKDAAHVDSGDHPIRKDDAGETIGGADDAEKPGGVGT